MVRIGLEVSRETNEKMLDYDMRMGIKVNPQMTLAPSPNAARAGLPAPPSSTPGPEASAIHCKGRSSHGPQASDTRATPLTNSE